MRPMPQVLPPEYGIVVCPATKLESLPTTAADPPAGPQALGVWGDAVGGRVKPR